MTNKDDTNSDARIVLRLEKCPNCGSKTTIGICAVCERQEAVNAFFDRFQATHDRLLEAIRAISDCRVDFVGISDEQEASVLLSVLMEEWRTALEAHRLAHELKFKDLIPAERRQEMDELGKQMRALEKALPEVSRELFRQRIRPVD